jgi:hypothetical protein
LPQEEGEGAGWTVPLRWHLLAAAKARGKTIDEYVLDPQGRSTWTRWYHVHEEIAFDILSARLEAAQLRRDGVDDPEALLAGIRRGKGSGVTP